MLGFNFRQGQEGFEFDAGIVGCELPVGFGLMLVASGDPGRDLVAQGGQIADTPVETLRGENAELALCHVEPASVLRRVMPFEALGQAARFLRRKRLVKRRRLVRVQIVRKTVCPLLRLRWLALRCASEGCSVV